MKKYYNIETMFRSLRDALRAFLDENGFYYEISGNGAYYHFEILADRIGADAINSFIDSVTITEQAV